MHRVRARIVRAGVRESSVTADGCESARDRRGRYASGFLRVMGSFASRVHSAVAVMMRRSRGVYIGVYSCEFFAFSAFTCTLNNRGAG